MRKVATALLLLCLLAAIAAQGQAPREFTVTVGDTVATVGDTLFSGTENQPIALNLVTPPMFHLRIWAVGGYRIPVREIEIIADGTGWSYRLFDTRTGYAWHDSLHIYSMGDADTLRIYGR